MAPLAALAVGAVAGRDLLPTLWPRPATVQTASGARPPQPVRVTRVTYAATADQHSFTGTIRPHQETPMAFRQPGKIIARLVEAGDRVVAGQVLARLDDTDARLTLESAAAEVTAARTDLERARAEADRCRRLIAEGHVTQAGLDAAVSAEAQAQARLDHALRQRDQAANGLSYATLVADAAGVVTQVSAEAGQVVAAGQPVAFVAGDKALDVVFALPEQMRQDLDGDVASAKLWGNDGHSYALTFRDISPDVDPATRTYRVRMALMAPDAAVSLGRTAIVSLTGSVGTPMVTLPLAAVMNDETGAAVWRLSPQETQVQRVPVEIAALQDNMAQLRGGLAEGDLVVSLGASRVDPAQPVRVVETAPAPAL